MHAALREVVDEQRSARLVAAIARDPGIAAQPDLAGAQVVLDAAGVATHAGVALEGGGRAGRECSVELAAQEMYARAVGGERALGHAHFDCAGQHPVAVVEVQARGFGHCGADMHRAAALVHDDIVQHHFVAFVVRWPAGAEAQIPGGARHFRLGSRCAAAHAQQRKACGQCRQRSPCGRRQPRVSPVSA